MILVELNTLVANLHMAAEIDSGVNILEATGAVWTSGHLLAILNRRAEEWAMLPMHLPSHEVATKLQLPNLHTTANAIGGWLSAPVCIRLVPAFSRMMLTSKGGPTSSLTVIYHRTPKATAHAPTVFTNTPATHQRRKSLLHVLLIQNGKKRPLRLLPEMLNKPKLLPNKPLT